MTTLLMTLEGPLQAWGVSSRYNHRETQAAPSKSGVIGLVAAALGLERTADISELAQLRFGVRIDKPGSIMTDFQTEQDAKGKSMPLTHRQYLQDAKFVAALEGEKSVLEGIQQALLNPVFPLFLGRRACPPSARVPLGIVEKPLAVALREVAPRFEVKQGQTTVLTIEREPEPDELVERFVPDQPVSFDPRGRKFGLRGVVSELVSIGEGPAKVPSPSSGHNPMELLEEV